jgi:hypothetical protein
MCGVRHTRGCGARTAHVLWCPLEQAALRLRHGTARLRHSVASHVNTGQQRTAVSIVGRDPAGTPAVLVRPVDGLAWLGLGLESGSGSGSGLGSMVLPATIAAAPAKTNTSASEALLLARCHRIFRRRCGPGGADRGCSRLSSSAAESAAPAKAKAKATQPHMP